MCANLSGTEEPLDERFTHNLLVSFGLLLCVLAHLRDLTVESNIFRKPA